MNGLISFALYGLNQLYIRGALDNLRLIPIVYPAFKALFCGPIESRDALQVLVDKDRTDGVPLGEFTWKETRAEGISCMYARFTAIADASYSHVIIRDCDSRLNWREQAATEAWIKSGNDACVMHDHNDHSNYAILGGMWGCKGGLFPNIEKEMEDWINRMIRGGRHPLDKLGDMYFAQEVLWPRIEKSCCHFSSVPTRFGKPEPFPPHRICVQHVGQIINVDARAELRAV